MALDPLWAGHSRIQWYGALTPTCRSESCRGCRRYLQIVRSCVVSACGLVQYPPAKYPRDIELSACSSGVGG